MTLCDYADSSKTQISGSVRVKKAISSIATNIKCKIQMLFFKSWHTCDTLFQISSYIFIMYHLWQDNRCCNTCRFKEEFSKNSLPCSLLSDQRKDMNTDNSDLSWFEKDLEDFDVLDDVGEGNSDEDDTTSKILWFKHDVCTKE